MVVKISIISTIYYVYLFFTNNSNYSTKNLFKINFKFFGIGNGKIKKLMIMGHFTKPSPIPGYTVTNKADIYL